MISGKPCVPSTPFETFAVEWLSREVDRTIAAQPKIPLPERAAMRIWLQRPESERDEHLELTGCDLSDVLLSIAEEHGTPDPARIALCRPHVHELARRGDPGLLSDACAAAVARGLVARSKGAARVKVAAALRLAAETSVSESAVAK